MKLTQNNKGLDELNSKYNKVVTIDDLNVEKIGRFLDEYYHTYTLESIANKLTFYENPKKVLCSDLKLLTKKSY